jgi:hypothetical protein
VYANKSKAHQNFAVISATSFMKTIGNQLLLYFKLHTGDGKQRGENLLIFGEDKNNKG